MAAAVSQLNGVQRALMQKYDQAYALAIARAERVEKELTQLKAANFEFEKLTQQMARLRQDVQGLMSPR